MARAGTSSGRWPKNRPSTIAPPENGNARVLRLTPGHPHSGGTNECHPTHTPRPPAGAFSSSKKNGRRRTAIRFPPLWSLGNLVVAFPGTRHDGVLYPPIVYHPSIVSGSCNFISRSVFTPQKFFIPTQKSS